MWRSLYGIYLVGGDVFKWFWKDFSGSESFFSNVIVLE